MTKAPATVDEPDEERCPNCGYCKHCGQAQPAAPVVIQPVIYPRPPTWHYPYWTTSTTTFSNRSGTYTQ